MRAFQWDGHIPPTPSLARYSTRHVRHMLSRRTFVGAAAGVAGAGLLWPTGALAAPRGSAPKPTASTTSIGGVNFHVTFFGPNVDPSSLTDFSGVVGVAQVQGTGTARSKDVREETLLFDTDMRFASGKYIGQDGLEHRGSFIFV